MAKRFYKTVSVETAEHGYQVLLDKRVLKTQNKLPLVCKKESQAELVAQEWREQGDEILPHTMPCTRLLNVAIEQTPNNREKLIAEFIKYIQTDLLCYQAQSPIDLAKRQEENWQKYLDWAEEKHGIKLNTTTGIKAIEQPFDAIDKASILAMNYDDIGLSLLLHYTASFGSAILALAVMDGFVSAGAAFDISRLDEKYQNELWGEDVEAVEKAAMLRNELERMEGLI